MVGLTPQEKLKGSDFVKAFVGLVLFLQFIGQHLGGKQDIE